MFSYLRSLLARRTFRRLPVIRFQSRPIDLGIDGVLHSGWEVALLDASGGTVGAAIYSLAPRTDRVYVHRLDIRPPMRRRGYGLAFLSYLHRTYQLPITAIDDVPDLRAFWRAARTYQSGALRVTSEQSSDEFRDELLQWQRRQAVMLGLRPPSTQSSDA
ncbi:hypothetical protein [Burkholderia sp. BCC1977]|uniref:hypothetical protein n=1 Tax=Burkholderia sp. BCC1977 TaxID=2817440 RepID=UPI002ABE4EBD|nr:hypothetical protein [Burkholderia sp. BCC1977]